MTIASSPHRPIPQCLTAVGIVSSVIFTRVIKASAGENNVLKRIDLVNEPVKLKDHALRLRMPRGPIVHKAGESPAGVKGTSHWWKNSGKETVGLLSADLFHDKDDAPRV